MDTQAAQKFAKTQSEDYYENSRRRRPLSKTVKSKKAPKFYKFLAGNLKCGYDTEFYYPAPTPEYDEKGKLKGWEPGAWVTMPNAPADGEACGVGLHLMKVLKPIYVRYVGNCYEAEGRDLLGEDNNKARFRSVRLLKPVPKSMIFKPKANLSRARIIEGALSPEQTKQIITSGGDMIIEKKET